MRRLVMSGGFVAALVSSFLCVMSPPARSFAAGPAAYDATFGPVASPGLVRLDAEMRADALDLLDDGSMVVAFNGAFGAPPRGVIRLDQQGVRDTGFGGAPGGVVDLGSDDGLVRDVDVTDAGAIVVTRDSRIVRLTANGTVDPTFNVIIAFGPLAAFSHLSIDAFGRLVVTGIDSFSQPLVARFTPAGILDNTFSPTSGVPGRLLLAGHPQHDPVMLPDGGFFVVGLSPVHPALLVIEKVTASGEADTSFGGDGTVTYTGDSTVTHIGLSATVDALGRLVVVGNINANTFAAQHALILRFLADGTPDTPFSNAAESTAVRLRYPREVMTLPNGDLLVVANFFDSKTVDGLPGVVVLNDDGTPASATGWPEGHVSELMLDEVSGAITLGARLDSHGRLLVWGIHTTGFVARLRAPEPVAFVGVSPGRVLDSRGDGVTVDDQFVGGGLLAGGSVFELPVGGRAGVPLSASAVALNVTVTESTASGFLTVFPCGSSRPNASSLNFVAGQTVPNGVLTKVGTGGKVCLFSQVPAHVIVDVNGYFD